MTARVGLLPRTQHLIYFEFDGLIDNASSVS